MALGPVAGKIAAWAVIVVAFLIACVGLWLAIDMGKHPDAE